MKKLISALACIMAVLFVISCGSTPEAEPEPTVKDAVEEIKKDVEETVDFSVANKSLLALTEAARQSAIEFGAEKYFSDGFSVAETKYTSIKNNVETDSSKDYSAEIKDLTARYNSLASASQASALKEKADALSYDYTMPAFRCATGRVRIEKFFLKRNKKFQNLLDKRR